MMRGGYRVLYEVRVKMKLLLSLGGVRRRIRPGLTVVTVTVTAVG